MITGPILEIGVSLDTIKKMKRRQGQFDLLVAFVKAYDARKLAEGDNPQDIIERTDHCERMFRLCEAEERARQAIDL